VGISAF